MVWKVYMFLAAHFVKTVLIYHLPHWGFTTVSTSRWMCWLQRTWSWLSCSPTQWLPPRQSGPVYFWNITLGHKHQNLPARDDKELLLKTFISVSKADCEMNLYLVRARHCPQAHVFLSCDVFKWITQHVFKNSCLGLGNRLRLKKPKLQRQQSAQRKPKGRRKKKCQRGASGCEIGRRIRRAQVSWHAWSVWVWCALFECFFLASSSWLAMHACK